MHLKILVHVLPLTAYMQLPLKSMAAAPVQLRAEFNLLYRSLSERWSQLLWKLSESSNHPRKCSSPDKERLPNKKCKTHVLVILVVLLRQRRIKTKVLCSCSSSSQGIACSAVPYVWIHIYIYIYVCMSVFSWVGEGVLQM